MNLGLFGLSVGAGLMLSESAPFVVGLATALGGVMAVVHYTSTPRPEERHYDVMAAARERHLQQAWARSLRAIDVDVEHDLLLLDVPDVPDFDHLLRPSASHDQLRLRSLRVVGRSAEVDAARFLRVDGRPVAAFTPVCASVLYLTRDELLIYVADIDLLSGAMKRERLYRLYLMEVVSITAETRFRPISGRVQALLARPVPWLGRRRRDMAVRESALVITKTDGDRVVVPVGVELVDADAGRPDVDERRFEYVAREVTRRVSDAKQATQ